MNSLPTAIRTGRTILGWNQRRLSEELGVKPPTITQWESGASKPSLDHRVKLAQLFGVGIEELLPEANDLREKIEGLKLRMEYLENCMKILYLATAVVFKRVPDQERLRLLQESAKLGDSRLFQLLTLAEDTNEFELADLLPALEIMVEELAS